MIRRALMLAVAATAAAAPVATAQSYRTVVESRRAAGEGQLRVEVEFAIGEFLLRPSADNSLYRLAMVYDEDRFEPDVLYSADSRRLDISLSSLRNINIGDADKLHQRLDLQLAPDVPLTLEAKFGAAEADLELGGLSLDRAEFTTGASSTTIRFSEPTRIACSRLEFQVGAAEFEAIGLANARCQLVELTGAVGELSLDLTGDWDATVETTVRVEMGLGELRLRFPEGLGVRMQVDRFLVGLDRSGFTKRGSSYVSDNYDSARATLNVEIEAALGNIEVDWVR